MTRDAKNPLERFSEAVSCAAGSSFAFTLAVLVVLVWGVTGPVFHYSDTWQLVINTGTTIVTFVMVFLIQRSQNKESLGRTAEAQRSRGSDQRRIESSDRRRGTERIRARKAPCALPAPGRTVWRTPRPD